VKQSDAEPRKVDGVTYGKKSADLDLMRPRTDAHGLGRYARPEPEAAPNSRSTPPGAPRLPVSHGAVRPLKDVA